jgi:quercetin dioxygenase-like cupin family protein
VSNLRKLFEVCGGSLIDLFPRQDQGHRKLVRSTERPRLALDAGAVLIEDLAVGPRQMEVQLWTIQPGAGSDGAYSHAGEEAMYLISGSLEVHLNGVESYSLQAGDCLYFPSAEPHRWRNLGLQPAVVLWVNTPPTF